MATKLKMIVLFVLVPSVTPVAMTSEPSCGNDVCGRQGYVACMRPPSDTPGADDFCMTCTLKRAKCGTVDEVIGCNKFCQDLVRNRTIDDLFEEQKIINATFSDIIQNLKEALNRSQLEQEEVLAKLQREKEDALAKLSSEKVDALAKLQSEKEDVTAKLQRENEDALTKLQSEHEEALKKSQSKMEDALAKAHRKTLIVATVLGFLVAGLLIAHVVLTKLYLKRSKKQGKPSKDLEKADHVDHKPKDGGQPDDEDEPLVGIQSRDTDSTRPRETESPEPRYHGNIQPPDHVDTEPLRRNATCTQDTQNGCPGAAKLSQIQPTNGGDTTGTLHTGFGPRQLIGTRRVTPVPHGIDH